MPSSKLVQITMIGNALTGARKHSWEAHPGQSVLLYAPAEVWEDPDVRILRNGLLLSHDEARETVSAAGDSLIFYWIPHGGFIVLFGVGIILMTGMMAVSAIVNPKARASEGDLDSSATYGFDGIVNTVRPGTPIPIIYGTHRIGGHIVGQYQREAREAPADGNPKSGELHTLIALCTGPIDQVSAVRVNRAPYSDFGSSVTYEARLGDVYQAPIEGFDDTVTSYPKDQALTAAAGALTFTTAEAVDAFELVIRFPGGLYSVSDTGQYRQRKVDLLVEYREVGTTIWTLATKAVAQKSANPFDAWYTSPRLDRAKYDIRITRLTPDDTSATGYSACSVLTLNEIQEDASTYPRIALLAVRQLPTAQVSGAPPEYDCLVKGKRVRVYSSLSTYSTAWSDNPAWCLLDYLTNTFDGLGAWIDDAKIDLQSFIDWAAFCDELVPVDEGGQLEKRARLNFVVDGSLPATDVIQQMCLAGRANFMLRGDKWAIRIDQPEDPIQLFQMTRIHRDSLQVTKRTRLELPNVLIGEFWNEAIDYEKDSLPWPDPTIPDDEEQRERTINLIGTTTASQAKRILNYLQLSNRLLRRDVEFEVGTEALAIEAGDVFSLAHDVPGWGVSGRVRSVDTTGTVVVLDRDVTIEAGKSYELTAIHPSSDAIDVVTVTNNPETTDRLTVSGDWSTAPVAGMDYSFGEVTKSTVTYRCLSITRSGDPTRRRVRAREYNAAVYGTDLTVLPAPSPSRLPDPERIPGDARDLRLLERQVYAEDGTLSTAIDVHFTLPSETGVRAQVYWRRAGDVMWEPVGGPVSAGYAAIERDVESPGATYEVSVVTISAAGVHKSPEDGVRGAVSTVGTTRQPGNVIGFSADRTPTGLVFRWLPLDPVANFDLDHYEIRDGASWDTAALVGRTEATTLETSIYVAGSRTFLIKAVNTAGKASPLAAAVAMTVPERMGENVVLTRQEETSWTGTKEGFVVSGSDLLLDTTADIVAWRATPSPPPTFSALISGGFGSAFRVTGVYTTEIFQIAADALRCLVSVDSEVDQIDTTLTWGSLTDVTWDSDFAKSRSWGVAPDGRVSTVIEMRFSTTTSDDASFGAWQERPQNIEVLAKWAQVRVRATIQDPAYTVKLKKLRIIFDVPDQTDSGTATTSAAGTVAVSYGKTFNAIPKVTAIAISAQEGDIAIVTDVTKTDFDLEVKNSAARVVRTVHWHAHGY